jgi:hypothetical protein
MKRLIIIALFLLLTTALVFAQQRAGGQEVGSPNPEMIGIDAAQQQLKEVSVEKFEYDGFWLSTMSHD